MGIRVTREEEESGLDLPEHGIEAYPELPHPVGAAHA
jgi:ammonia channel protein AmtB